MIDFHVHLAGSGCCDSGITLSRAFQRRPAFLALKVFQGITSEQMRTDIDAWWVRRIVGHVHESAAVEKAVVLCFDAVHREDGTRDADATQLHVPNTWGLQAVEAHRDALLWGASIHPYRRDALEELVRAKERGAFLVKWLPSAMGIDPAAKACLPFYEFLAAARIPLLSHVDTEYTFAAAGKGWMEKNHVRHLRPALERGVTVIAAHAGTPTQSDELVTLMEEFPALYADSSGLFNPTRARCALALFAKARASVLGERLVYGSDWPVPTVAYLLYDVVGVEACRKVMRIANPFDRDMEMKKLLGFSTELFEANEAALLARLGR